MSPFSRRAILVRRRTQSGALAIFEERNISLTSLGEYRAPHAHTVPIDLRTHRIYLPLQRTEGKPVLRILAPATE